MNEGVLTVSDLTAQIQGMLSTTFDQVLVQGEISQPRPSRPGHVYLTLKDGGAVLPAVLWRSTVTGLRFEPEEGLEVIARGYIDVYPPHGRYQLIIRQLEPVGAGALQLAFDQLRARLEAEGLFAPEQKVPLPALPRRIALVTSKTSAAVRDMVHVIHRRMPSVEIVLLSVRVQGEGAAQEIASAIQYADTHAGADVIITGRGGGAIEDLWAFNEEVVARAIAACETPVVSAVGHETDVTIADLVADVRAATPSMAGELVVPDRAALARQVEAGARQLQGALRRRLDRAWQRVEAWAERPVLRTPAGVTRPRQVRLAQLAQRLAASRPAALLARRRERIAELQPRLHRAEARRIERAAARIAGLEGRLRALSPLAVLGRGYSLTSVDLPDGGRRVVRSADHVAVGDTLHTRLASGAELQSRVEQINTPSGDSAPMGEPT